MKYISQKTIKGNTSYSFVSQEDAEKRAAKLDHNNCTNCTNCYNCYNCTNCTNCIGCIGCTNCTGHISHEPNTHN